MQRVKTLQPEEIAARIEQFDKDLCTETFLGELKNLLPTPEQVKIRFSAYGTYLHTAVGWKIERVPKCRRGRIRRTTPSRSFDGEVNPYRQARTEDRGYEVQNYV